MEKEMINFELFHYCEKYNVMDGRIERVTD